MKENEITDVKEAMLNVVHKLNNLLDDENRDVDETKQSVTISTALTGAAKTYLSAIALEVKVKEIHDKGI